MTNEEHIEQLKKLRSFHNGSYGRSINKAIKALEQEPKYCDHNICVSNEYNGIGCDECEVKAEQEQSTDAVSRQDSLNMAYKLVEELASSSVYWDELKLFAKEQVQSLPPVTPTRPKGHWLYSDDLYETYICSECNYDSEDYDKYKFCPNCGADMREGEV